MMLVPTDRAFDADYHKRTGEHWWSYWPPRKPKYHIWDASEPVR